VRKDVLSEVQLSDSFTRCDENVLRELPYTSGSVVVQTLNMIDVARNVAESVTAESSESSGMYCRVLK
jgi:hypothetical protein